MRGNPMTVKGHAAPTQSRAYPSYLALHSGQHLRSPSFAFKLSKSGWDASVANILQLTPSGDGDDAGAPARHPCRRTQEFCPQQYSAELEPRPTASSPASDSHSSRSGVSPLGSRIGTIEHRQPGGSTSLGRRRARPHCWGMCSGPDRTRGIDGAACPTTASAEMLPDGDGGGSALTAVVEETLRGSVRQLQALNR